MGAQELGTEWGTGGVSRPSPIQSAHTSGAQQVERKEPVGERRLGNPSLPQAFSRSRRAVKSQAGLHQWKGSFPEPLSSGFMLSPGLNRWLGLGRTPVAQTGSRPEMGFPGNGSASH